MDRRQRTNALTVRVPAGGLARVRLPPCQRWQWAAWGLGAGSASLSLEGPGFTTGAIQTIAGPGGMSAVNVDPGPDVFIRIASATECQAVILVDGA